LIWPFTRRSKVQFPFVIVVHCRLIITLRDFSGSVIFLCLLFQPRRLGTAASHEHTSSIHPFASIHGCQLRGCRPIKDAFQRYFLPFFSRSFVFMAISQFRSLFRHLCRPPHGLLWPEPPPRVFRSERKDFIRAIHLRAKRNGLMPGSPSFSFLHAREFPSPPLSGLKKHHLHAGYVARGSGMPL